MKAGAELCKSNNVPFVQQEKVVSWA